MNNQTPFTLLFDNAGGILLQTKDYCHHYNDPERAAEDVYHILNSDNPKFWDNNEPEHRMDNYDYDQDDVNEILLMSYREDRHCGFSEKEFFAYLSQNI